MPGGTNVLLLLAVVALVALLVVNRRRGAARRTGATGAPRAGATRGGTARRRPRTRGTTAPVPAPVEATAAVARAGADEPDWDAMRTSAVTLPAPAAAVAETAAAAAPPVAPEAAEAPGWGDEIVTDPGWPLPGEAEEPWGPDGGGAAPAPEPEGAGPAPVTPEEGWLGGDAEPLGTTPEDRAATAARTRPVPGEEDAPGEAAGGSPGTAEAAAAPPPVAEDWNWGDDLDGLRWAPDAAAPVVDGWSEGRAATAADPAGGGEGGAQGDAARALPETVGDAAPATTDADPATEGAGAWILDVPEAADPAPAPVAVAEPAPAPAAAWAVPAEPAPAPPVATVPAAWEAPAAWPAPASAAGALAAPPALTPEVARSLREAAGALERVLATLGAPAPGAPAAAVAPPAPAPGRPDEETPDPAEREAHDLVARVARAYAAAAGPRRAAGMRARCGGRFAFLGVAAHDREVLDRDLAASLPDADPATLAAVARRCWDLPEREYAHFACDLLRRHAARLPAGFIGELDELIGRQPWTDTVDRLAERCVGPLRRAQPATAATIDGWIAADVWHARAALLHQVHLGRDTDADRLFGYCLARGDDEDPLITGAIGRALRRHARTDPDGVRAFLTRHGADLSAASRAEAARDL